MKPHMSSKKHIGWEVDQMLNNRNPGTIAHTHGHYEEPLRITVSDLLASKGVRYPWDAPTISTYILRNRGILQEVITADEPEQRYFLTPGVEGLLLETGVNLEKPFSRDIDRLLVVYPLLVKSVDLNEGCVCALYSELGMAPDGQSSPKRYQKDYRSDPLKGSHVIEHALSQDWDNP